MSRIGKAPIKLPQGVKVEIKGGLVKVEGPKGKLQHVLSEDVELKLEAGVITVSPKGKGSAAKVNTALQGVTRAVIGNMVQGVHAGYNRELDIVGVGYKAAVKGTTLSMTLGFSHPIEFPLPAGISAKVENNTHIVLTGADKVLIGMVASQIRKFKKPEPYQGKGVRYTNEHIVKKQGKAAAGAGAK